ncbi:MAG: AAA family ATPase [Candidatus Diapherotrites archaeon]|nr:AAA family ATPase [Candidatus Diapherotrites archaeon]
MIADVIKGKLRKENGEGTLIIIGSKDFRHGIGRSRIAKTLAEMFGAVHYSTGDKFREKAREKNMSIVEYVEYVGKHPRIDKEFDQQVKKEVESLIKSGKSVVADSNLLVYFTKPDVSILVDAPDDIRGRRVYEKHRPADSKYDSPEDALGHLKRRDYDDRKRYEKLYGIDADELSKKYDFQVVNDGHIDDTLNEILEKIYKKIVKGGKDAI